MPQLERCDNLPGAVRQRRIERMRERAVSLSDLNQLRLWVETRPEVPEGDWYQDFGSFKLCGSGSYPKKFLLKGKLQRAKPSDHRVSVNYSCLVAKGRVIARAVLRCCLLATTPAGPIPMCRRLTPRVARDPRGASRDRP